MICVVLLFNMPLQCCQHHEQRLENKSNPVSVDLVISRSISERTQAGHDSAN